MTRPTSPSDGVDVALSRQPQDRFEVVPQPHVTDRLEVVTEPEEPAPRAFPLLPRRNSPAGRAVLLLAGALERLDPSQTTLRWGQRRRKGHPVLATCIYRRRNAAVVADLVRRSAPSTRWALWALDETAPALAALTLGEGSGARLALHEAMAERSGISEAEYWAVVDDDVRLGPRALWRLVEVAHRASLDVSAPSHALTSFWSHRFTVKRPLSIVRLTHFVEIGPVVVLSPRAREELLPLPSGAPAGWGLESYWTSLRRPSLRLGLVDAVTVKHLTPMGRSYDARQAYERGVEFARTLGVVDFGEEQRAMMTTLATWRPWRAMAPWGAQPSRRDTARAALRAT